MHKSVTRTRVSEKSASTLPQLAISSFPKKKPDIIRKPFLKWAGRKTKLVGAIRPFLPAGAKRFIEPFVGSGAVFINTDYPSSLLSDSNEDIISLFRILQEEKDDFIRYAQKIFTPKNNT